MAEGLIIAIHFRQTEGSERVKSIWSHAVMQLRAAVLVIIGFGVIYRNKVRVPVRPAHGPFARPAVRGPLCTTCTCSLDSRWRCSLSAMAGAEQRYALGWCLPGHGHVSSCS